MTDQAPNLSPQARRLIAAGELLFGQRWRRRMADALGVSHGLINFIASGERVVTPEIDAKVDALLDERMRVMRAEFERLRAARQTEAEIAPEDEAPAPGM